MNDTKTLSSKEQSEPAIPKPHSESRDSFSLPMVQGLRVLVLGQFHARRDRLVKELKRHGIKAFSGTVDDDGYERALTLFPDVVISEIARPGDDGWWLFQRIHRHPSLQWIPTLLMKWWKEEDNTEIILTQTVLERLAESLTAIRLLEERIAAGRKLHDRIETIGIPAVMTVLGDAGLTGTLNVNDSWNMFELDFVKGHPTALNRVGVDGLTSRGAAAFLQLLITNAGHWTFRTHDSAPRPTNLEMSLPVLLKQANEQLARMFGPAVTRDTVPNFNIEASIFEDVATDMDDAIDALFKAVIDRSSSDLFEGALRDISNIHMLEQTLVKVLRTGGITPLIDNESNNGLANSKIALLLEWISNDHRLTPLPPRESGRNGRRGETQVGGYYSLSNTTEEQLHRNSDIAVPPPRTSIATVAISEDERMANAPDSSETTPIDESDANWRRTYYDTTEDEGSARMFDSLAPDPASAHPDKLHLWLAVGIAVVMTVILVILLITVTAEPDTPKKHRTTDGITESH